jgi:hypothetical protein
MGARRWLGIDFSGDLRMWGPRRRSNVWIAEVIEDRGARRLATVRRVQELPGEARPFARLAALLAAGGYDAAGIDAPFSVPAAFVHGDHAATARAAAALAGRRDFASGKELVRLLAGRPPPLTPEAKPLRETERYWARRRGPAGRSRKVELPLRAVNVRSTMWAGPRGGAPMTAACLTLLHTARRPVWPFSPPAPGLGLGFLVEAFPAAQLATWSLPFTGYGGVAGSEVRRELVEGLERLVELGAARARLLESADALDAVLAAFAGRAVLRGLLVDPPRPIAAREGWIAVHAVLDAGASPG